MDGVINHLFKKCGVSGKDLTAFPSNFSPIYLGGDGKEYRTILKCVSVFRQGEKARG